MSEEKQDNERSGYIEPEPHDDPEIHFKRKVDAMANIDLLTTAFEQEEISHLLKDLDEDQRKEVVEQTSEVASSYEELLHKAAVVLRDTKKRKKLIEELLQRL